MKKTVWTALLILAPVTVLAQDPAQVQKLFEAGKYQQVVDATRAEADPAVLYTAAQSLQKLGSVDQAVQLYGRLADRSENDPWRLVGRSARQARPRLLRKLGTSDLNLAAPAWGCPAAAYGPGDSHLDHTDRESLDIRDFQRSIKILRNAFARLTRGSPTATPSTRSEV